MPVDDILIDKPFRNGDFQIDNTDYQNVQAIILCNGGHFYQWATLGVDIRRGINSPTELQFFRARTANELNKDNYNLTRYDVQLDPSGEVQLDIDAVKLR